MKLRKLLASSDSSAVILIRFLAGGVFFAEGVKKFLFAAQWGSERFERIGIPWPQFTGPFVGVVEIVGGLLLMAGLLLGGACFILPAALLTAMIAWAYTRFGSLPQATGILYGIRPVVVAIIFQALWRLGQTALKNKVLMIIAVGAAAASLADTMKKKWAVS